MLSRVVCCICGERVYTLFEDGRVVGYIILSFEEVDEIEVFFNELFFFVALLARVLC